MDHLPVSTPLDMVIVGYLVCAVIYGAVFGTAAVQYREQLLDGEVGGRWAVAILAVSVLVAAAAWPATAVVLFVGWVRSRRSPGAR